MAERLNIHAVIHSSRVNGPGRRLVVFFQGCVRKCAGCFNEDTHTLEDRNITTSAELLEHVGPGIEGLTVSGGEPFLQPKGLTELLIGAKAIGLTTIVYTGFTIGEVRGDAALSPALDYIDVLVDGPFVEDLAERTTLARGSSNQNFCFLTDRYGFEDFIMPGKVEVTIKGDGSVVETGFSRIIFRDKSSGND